jgi:hypothetical protein
VRQSVCVGASVVWQMWGEGDWLVWLTAAGRNCVFITPATTFKADDRGGQF